MPRGYGNGRPGAAQGGLVLELKLDDPEQNYVLVRGPGGEEMRVTVVREAGASAQKVRLVFADERHAFRVLSGKLLAKLRREPVRESGLRAALEAAHGIPA